MRITLLAIACVFAFASAARAQQTSQGQDDQSGQTRQTTSTDWSSTGAKPPEQAGDLYQGKTRNSGAFGGAAAPDGTILPGALNPGTDSLDNGKQPEPKE